MAVRAASLNFTDVLMMKGLYQEKPPLPFVPCMDGAGIVLEVGSGVTGFREGDHVLTSGVPGMASGEVLIAEERLVPVPPGVDSAAAAGSINSHLTAFHGLVDRAGLREGETLLVLGASGAVGSAVEIGRLLGARVLAAVRERDRAAEVLKAGADEAIVLAEGDLRSRLLALTGGEGVDVVLDPVGGAHFEQALRCLRWRGRILVVGFAGGEIPKVPVNLALLKGCSVVGVYCGGLLLAQFDVFRQQIREVLRLLGEGRIRPVLGRGYTLDDFPAAYAAFHEDGRRGKVILLPGA
ncbi:MAG: NADPH:quinone oxidoreductase family protein [Deltaproteobacteria bacterium]|nr:NADPH:quinone oxidoreductase family protein [Deltaproteobacteria bacterium]